MILVKEKASSPYGRVNCLSATLFLAKHIWSVLRSKSIFRVLIKATVRLSFGTANAIRKTLTREVHLLDIIRPNSETPESILYTEPLSIIVGEIAAAARRCSFTCETLLSLALNLSEVCTGKTVCSVGRDSSVGIKMLYGLDGLGIESRWGRDFPHPSRPALGPTQPPILCVPGLSQGKSGRGVALNTQPHVELRLKK
jgi:hypothetical protein